MLAAAEPQPDWPHKVIAALRALLDFLAAEPLLARLALVEPVSAGAELAEHFRAAVIGFAPYLHAGRGERPKAAALPASTEDSLLGALVSILSRWVAARRPLEVPRLTSELGEFLLTPYVGAKRAAALAEEAAAGR
jgi:hypothetical protein